MALTHSQAPKLGSVAPDFSLLGVDNEGREKNYSLESFASVKALVIVFYCNHCPYVIAVQKRVNDLAREYARKGVALVAINSNDSIRYPDDSFPAMKIRAKEEDYVFPYLHDDTQEVARAYGAVCTPDFFVYKNESRPADKTEAKFTLKYAGRMDDSWKDESQVKHRDLAQALDEILSNRDPSTDQTPSMGCSIKWKM